MTKVTRKIVRESGAAIHSAGKSRPIIVSLSPGGDGGPGPSFLGLRLHGTRQTYYLPISWCYQEAIRADVAHRRAEKKRQVPA